MKKLLASLMVLTMIFAVGCGGSGGSTSGGGTPSGGTDPQKTPVQEGSRLVAYFKDFGSGDSYSVMKMEMDIQGNGNKEMTTITSAVAGDDVYTDTLAESGARVTMMKKGDSYYLISHDEKAVMVMKDSMIEGEGEVESIPVDEFVEDLQYTSGEEEINGTKYYYEEVSDELEEGGVVRYYFDGADLKYMKHISDEEMLIEIVEYTNKVPDGLFELPSDYQVNDMSAYM